MHGRLKVRTTAEQQELKQKERARKLAIYKNLVGKIFSKRDGGELDEEMLKLTGQVLAENPDIYTFWNIRKETILGIKERLPDQLDDFIANELSITEQCVRVNPKSYHSWYHRSWVLDLGSVINYENELLLCDKCLKLDDRNFHCWDYRRTVVEKSGASLQKELDFSTQKIESNFSNYSSWHYRSKLLPIIHPGDSPIAKINLSILSKECQLVQNAIYTDPNDQSAWFYQRWLLFSAGENLSDEEKSMLVSVLKRELESCQQLYELEPNNKWVIVGMCEILRHIDNKVNQAEILRLASQLCIIDPLRKGFYKDWSSIAN